MIRALPNLLSIARIFLVAPIVLRIRAGEEGGALLFLALALATDGADGWVARRFAVSSELGRRLDPLADKLLAGALALSLWAWRGLPGWFLLVVLGRDLLLLAGGLVVIGRRRAAPLSNAAGKIAFSALGALFLLWLLPLARLRPAALVVTTALLLFSLLLYARRGAGGLGGARWEGPETP